MDKKTELKKASDSHNFMDKILNKLKMTKHGGEEKANKSGKKSDSGSTSIQKKPLISWENCKLSFDNIMEFSDQLHNLLEYVQTMKDVVYYTYEYPNSLNDKLEKEAIELRNLFRDIRAAAIDVERLQKQRLLIKKEKCVATKKLDTLKEEEIRELESIVFAYSKPLHSRWETIKNSQNVDILENFMNEVIDKHQAIEILQELVRRKIARVTKKTSTAPISLKKNANSNNKSIKVKGQEKPSNWNISTFPDVEKLSQSIDKAIRGGVDRDMLRMNRRRRQRELRDDKRRQNLNNTVNNNNNKAENAEGLNIQLMPIENFTAEDVDDVITTSKIAAATATSTSRTPSVLNIECTYDDDIVSMSSSNFTIENFVPNNGTDIRSEIENEMRTVIQALFGRIHEIPQTERFSTRNNSGNDLRSHRTATH